MRSIFFAIILLFIGQNLFAQELNPVSWTSKVDHVQGDEYLLTFVAEIEDSWNVYSQFTSDDGPVPTEIVYETDGFDLVGKGEESGHKKEGYDKLFETNVIKFLGDQNFTIKQKIKNKGAKEIVGYLTYMTCDAERCLPPTDYEFSFTLPPSAGGGKASTTKKAVTDVAAAASTVASQQKEKLETAIVETAKAEKEQVQEKPTTEKPASKFNNITSTSSTGSNFVVNSSIEEIESDSPTEEMPEEGMADPVKWNLEIKKVKEGEYDIIYTADIDDDWNVYSQYTSAEDGPLPTEIVFEESKGVEQVGENKEKGHKKEGPDPLFDNVNVIKFLGDEDFVITQRVKANEDSKLKGYLTYMACDDAHCTPPTDVEFEVNFAKSLIGAPGTIPMATAAAANAATNATIPAGTSKYLPIDQRVPSIRETYANPPINCGGEEQGDRSIVWSFVLGFLGGLLALLTPCVFPMIPLTVSFFTKDTKRSGFMNGLIYGASIIVIYVGMGLLLTAFFGTEALNALSTNWIANTIFFFIFIFFAFSFFGYYEITLPSSWTTKSDSMADKGGLLGIFFMAFTLALVSFSCTGPIIGSAIVSAASSAVGPAVVMLGFSLALAIPFGFFAAFPSWLNSLPKSGGWMNSVKVILGFLELAFAFKFLSVADMTSHWGFLKYELFMAIWVLVALGMTLYLFGVIKFPHDSPVKKLSIPRKVMAFGCLALTVYLATGFMKSEETGNYNSLGLTSGIAPPSNYNFFLDEKEANLNQSIKSKYPSYTFCANKIPCFKEYSEGLEYAKEKNKPVFLDFTGHGCVNCRKTEEFIWVKDPVKKALKEDFVLVSLYVDDREKLEQQFISIRDKEYKLRNVGNKWADFQIVNFEQNSQPLYVMMTNDEKVVSNPRGYREGWKDYMEYLDCGLKHMKTKDNTTGE